MAPPSVRLAILLVAAGVCAAVPFVEEKEVGYHEVTVRTNAGPIIGHKSLFSAATKFLGVPFAAPPLGPLRWRAPQPHATWVEPRPAHKLPPSCAQVDNALAWGKNTSEDCLYLNIFTPRNNQTSAPVPVLVWFYGGSYEVGGTSIPLYDGEFDATAEDVIVVTVNYRVGVFGFLGSAMLQTSGDMSTGNYGILDQRAALHWVQSNIGTFGGDATRVTIFGQSAGGGSVANHLVSPYSEGLFHAAIMQSGPFAPWTSRSMKEAEAEFAEIAKNTNCSSSSSDNDDAAAIVACLRSLSTDTLVHARMDLKLSMTWAPTVDGVELTNEVQALGAAGAINAVPVMLGTTADEGTTLIGLKEDCTVAEYNAWMLDTFGADLASKLNALYPLANYSSPWHAGVAGWTDWGMICPTRRTARWLRNVPEISQVYLYHFTHVPAIVKVAKPSLGSFHGAELAFVFRLKPIDITIGEKRLSNVLSRLWTNFAKTGNPNAAKDDKELEGVPKWPVYDQVSDTNMVMDTGLVFLEMSLQQGLRKTYCDFWDTLV